MNPRDKNPLLYAQKIWTSFGLPTTSLAHLHLSPLADLAINSHFRLGTAAQTSVGLSALAATRFHELRTGITQDVTVDPRHAVIAFSSEKYYLLDNKMPQVTLFDDLAGVYPTRDGYVRLHTNFPHHKRGLLQILECLPDRSSVSEALRQWGAAEFEQEAIRRGMCAVALRPFEALDLCSGGDESGFIPLKITKIGDAPRRSATADVGFHGAFEGIRVVDMTRVLAGPVCGRTLAAHGADVLLVTSPNLPALPALDVDTSRGKRTTQLDLDADADVATFRRLLTDADVFLQAYRPGGLTSRGFSPSSLAQLRPGIICASLSAYPPDSAWGHVRGFDSLVQTMSGMNVAEAEAYARFVSANGGETTNLPPYRALPMQALDHAAGYFLAFGIATALCKTIEEGGSWLIEVSLYGVMKWIRELGTLDPQEAFGRGKPLPPRSFPPHSEITALHEDVKICQDRMRESASAATLTAVKHPAVLGKTTKSPTFHFAPMELDVHPAQWADMKGI